MTVSRAASLGPSHTTRIGAVAMVGIACDVTRTGSRHRTRSLDCDVSVASSPPPATARRKPPTISLSVTRMCIVSRARISMILRAMSSGDGSRKFGTWKTSHDACQTTRSPTRKSHDHRRSNDRIIDGASLPPDSARSMLHEAVGPQGVIRRGLRLQPGRDLEVLRRIPFRLAHHARPELAVGRRIDERDGELELLLEEIRRRLRIGRGGGSGFVGVLEAVLQRLERDLDEGADGILVLREELLVHDDAVRVGLDADVPEQHGDDLAVRRMRLHGGVFGDVEAGRGVDVAGEERRNVGAVIIAGENREYRAAPASIYAKTPSEK